MVKNICFKKRGERKKNTWQLQCSVCLDTFGNGLGMPDMDRFTATCSEDRVKEMPKYLSEKSPEKASTQMGEGAMHPSCCRWSPQGAEQQALRAGRPLVPANTCPALTRHTQNFSLLAGWYFCHWPSFTSSCNIYSHLNLTSIVLGLRWFSNWAYKWKELNALLLSYLLAA